MKILRQTSDNLKVTKSRLKNKLKHRVQRRMISADFFFLIFEIINFCFVVAICDLVHAVEATYGLP